LNIRTVDRAGNWNSNYVYCGPFFIDTEPPSTSITSVSGTYYNGWYKDSVSITISASDSRSGIYRIYYRWYKQGSSPPSWSYYTGSTVSFTVTADAGTGTYIVEYYAQDNAGNVESVNQYQVNIDANSPSVSVSLSGTIGNNYWYRSSVTITIEALDSGVGIDYIRYRVDSGNWQTYYGSSFSFTVSSNGQHTIEYYAVDKFGHTSDIEDVTFKIDTTKPSSTISLSGTSMGGWYKDSLSATISASDTYSGVYRIYYRYYKQGTTPPSWSYYTGSTVTFTVYGDSGTGTYVIEWYAVDNAGNVEDTNSYTVRIDADPPITSINLYGYNNVYENWYSGIVMISFNASDAGSGVDKIYYKIGDSEWQVYEEPIAIYETGVYYIYYKSVDVVGNVEAEKQFILKVDNTPPRTWVSYAPSEVGTDTFTIEFEYEDQHSGFNHVELYYRINDGNWVFYGNFSSSPITFVAPSDGLYYFMLIGVDNVGNREQKSEYDASVFVDFSPPIIEVLSPENLSYVNTSNIYVEWNVTDLGSGVYLIEIYLNGTYVTNSSQAHSSYLVSVLNCGWYEITIYALDNLGHGDNVSIYVYVDYKPPYIAIEYPIDGEIYDTTSITISWRAYDNESGILETHILVNGTLEGIVNGTVFTYTVKFDADGWYIITLVAYDRARNTQRASVYIGVDAYPPIVEYIFPSNHTATNNDTLLVYVAAYDAMGMSYVQFEFDGSLIKIDYDPPYDVALDLSSENEGRHIINVTLSDMSGHIRTLILIIYIDRTPPRISVSGIYNDSIVVGIVDVEVSIEENLWLESVVVDIDGQVIHNTTSEEFIIKLDTLTLSDGVHILTIHAIDRAGNEDTTRLRIIIDNNPPEVELISPTNNSWASYNATLRMYVYDATSVNLTIYIDEDLYTNLVIESNYSEISIDFSTVREGQHQIILLLKDEANNTKRLAINITVDKTPPIITPETYEINASNLPIEFSVDISDNFAVDYVIVYLDSESMIISKYTDINDDKLVISIKLENISPGRHTIIVCACDYAGNVAEAYINLDYEPITTSKRGTNMMPLVLLLIVVAIIIVAFIIKKKKSEWE